MVMQLRLFSLHYKKLNCIMQVYLLSLTKRLTGILAGSNVKNLNSKQ